MDQIPRVASKLNPLPLTQCGKWLYCNCWWSYQNKQDAWFASVKSQDWKENLWVCFLKLNFSWQKSLGFLFLVENRRLRHDFRWVKLPVESYSLRLVDFFFFLIIRKRNLNHSTNHTKHNVYRDRNNNIHFLWYWETPSEMNNTWLKHPDTVHVTGQQ